MSLMDRIRDCQNNNQIRLLPFFVDGNVIGHISQDFARILTHFSDIFTVQSEQVFLARDLIGYAHRSSAIAQALQIMRNDGVISGWRDELYPVGTAFNKPPLFEIERAAVPLFGVPGYGVHMNGWLKKNGCTYMWIAERSMSKATGPGKLDQMVGGGQPVGMSLRGNLLKECYEEANIPDAIAANAKSVGTVSYRTVREEGLRNDILFNFDLEVPIDFEPRNNDGEVASFVLWEIQEVMQRLSDTDDFKFNSALVIIDFLVRHGFIDADDPDYFEVVTGLHI